MLRRLIAGVLGSLAALLVPGALPAPGAETTVYVNQYFEVRDHDQPVKYVFHGETRVARVTRSLSANTRIQRLRLYPGWNLRALAVSEAKLSPAPEIDSAYQWNPASQDWGAVSTNESLSAGTILWLHATTNSTLSVTGTYIDPTNRLVPPGRSFQSNPALEALPHPDQGAGMELWHYDAATQSWRLSAPDFPGTGADAPDGIAPGEAVFLHAEGPAEVEMPEGALSVRYYHQDHLGSSSVITDGD